MMQTSLAGKMFICGLEGICLSKYLDSVGVWTIGVGCTRSEIPDLSSWPISKTLTIPEVFNLFTNHLVEYENAVNTAIKVEISQNQFDALVSICYNIGTGGLKNSTFIKRINAKMPLKEISNAILMWNKPKEIIGRRTKESILYTSGVYAGNGEANLFPVSSSGKPMYSKGKNINLLNYLK